MKKNFIIFSGIILVVVAGTFYIVHYKNTSLLLTRTPPTTPSGSEPQILSPQDPHSEIVYTPDGKLDTSSWQEYRSEYGGFSVRAPRGMSQFISCTHACDSYWGERFEYLLARMTNQTDNYYVEPPGLSVEVIEKNSTSTLDTLLNDQIVYGRNYLTNLQKTRVGDYPALQFDFDAHQPKTKEGLGFATMQYDSYPWGYTSAYDLSNPPYAVSRYVIIDLGDRYAFVQYTLSVDKKAEVAYFTSNSYYYWVQASQLLDSKNLTDIYTAILSSFQAFPPTKS